MRPWSAAAAVLAALLLANPAAAHHGTLKKAMWGPPTPDAFRTYHDLGVGIYQTALNWSVIAPTRPAHPANPNDPAYVWPPELGDAIRQADRYGMRVMVMMIGTPSWANGGRPWNWVPERAADFAAFAKAAARRYRPVRYWQVWGEPVRQPNFMPLDPETLGERLTRAERWAPRKYARMLDKTYRALKAVRRRNIVIGGNSYTAGDISPLNLIRYMRLPNGKRPRMDLYGHNPFSTREPDLRQPLLMPGTGLADFSDLDTLRRWLNRHGYRDNRGKRMRIFIAEWTAATDHPNTNFNFWVTREVQARWTRLALRIVCRRRWIHTLGWIALYDQAPRPDGLEANWGLIDGNGQRKPAYKAYRNGCA